QENILDDLSVQYFCTSQQNRTSEVNNFTMKEKITPYCNDSSSAELLIKVLGEPVTITIPDLYKASNYSISWYKNCTEYMKNTSQVSFTSVQQSDSAVYTYVITQKFNSENYSVCGKKLLIVKAPIKEYPITNIPDRIKSTKGHREHIKPRIIGVENETKFEVEIGGNLTIRCEASVIRKMFAQLYWVQTNKSMVDDPKDIVNHCTPNSTTTCMVKINSPDLILITELHLRNISKDDINYPYNCILQSIQGGDKKTYFLRLKAESQDISNKVFTTSIIASITCSVSIVLLIGLCILFRIHIVLLYRSITGVDETIGDGKEYDAYLSLESFSTFESEERRFAFQTLIPILENNFGYKLCIFERDAIPGGALVDDMNSFLEKSRRLIIVLSKDFTSGQTMYDFESGLHKAMVERKIKVILIEFTPLSEKSLQPESLQLLKKKNRVKWKGDKSCPLNSQFWTKIQYLMPAKPIKSSNSFPMQKTSQSYDNEA
ncbi:interleukin-18 receptor 1-like, partial [Leptodactylus fuscus]|uniref:interleukin-18 receptor 1-like n=1 Tax=Leptodactylus fuscus TaxID=238119 RepID=UPI003F4E4D77